MHLRSQRGGFWVRHTSTARARRTRIRWYSAASSHKGSPAALRIADSRTAVGSWARLREAPTQCQSHCTTSQPIRRRRSHAPTTVIGRQFLWKRVCGSGGGPEVGGGGRMNWVYQIGGGFTHLRRRRLQLQRSLLPPQTVWGGGGGSRRQLQPKLQRSFLPLQLRRRRQRSLLPPRIRRWRRQPQLQRSPSRLPPQIRRRRRRRAAETQNLRRRPLLCPLVRWSAALRRSHLLCPLVRWSHGWSHG